MRIFTVKVGDYDERQYYIVCGATSAEDARMQVDAWHKEHYGDSTSWDFDIVAAEVAEITLDNGVTQL